MVSNFLLYRISPYIYLKRPDNKEEPYNKDEWLQWRLDNLLGRKSKQVCYHRVPEEMNHVLQYIPFVCEYGIAVNCDLPFA